MKFQGFVFSFFLVVACFALRTKRVFYFSKAFYYYLKSTFLCLCAVGNYSKFRNVYFRPELFIRKFRNVYFRAELFIRKFWNVYFTSELFIRKFRNVYFTSELFIRKVQNVYFRAVLSFRKFQNVYFKSAISIRKVQNSINKIVDTKLNLYFSIIISIGDYSHVKCNDLYLLDIYNIHKNNSIKFIL